MLGSPIGNGEFFLACDAQPTVYCPHFQHREVAMSSEDQKIYFVLAYYLFTPVDDPKAEVDRHHAFFQGKDAVGRIYISSEGINGQMSASLEVAEAYMDWLRSDIRFKAVVFKRHRHHEQVFPRMTVKVRKQLVAIDVPVDHSQTAEHVSAAAWNEMLDKRDADTLVLDVRNDYEWEVGHFEGAELPKLDTFRRFPAYAKELKGERDLKKTKVMMYCTGGIRCELYSALLKQEGFENVYQLDGGVIGYGLQEGNKHWRGKLFVFDDRLAVPISKEESEVISCCHHCGMPSDVYYNCANMDCNALFLSCPQCAERLQGCCCSSCQQAPRLRPYEKRERPKPFRRKSQCSLI
jgi:UPF0176 protein